MKTVADLLGTRRQEFADKIAALNGAWATFNEAWDANADTPLDRDPAPLLNLLEAAEVLRGRRAGAHLTPIVNPDEFAEDLRSYLRAFRDEVTARVEADRRAEQEEADRQQRAAAYQQWEADEAERQERRRNGEIVPEVAPPNPSLGRRTVVPQMFPPG